jgi:hypothetical protein
LLPHNEALGYQSWAAWAVWGQDGLIRQGFGSRGEKFGSRERVAIVERGCEIRSCGDSVGAEGMELFAKLAELLGAWRIIRAVRTEVVAGPRVVGEMCMAKKSPMVRRFVRFAHTSGTVLLLMIDQDFKDRGFRCDPRVNSGAVSVWKQK